MISVGVENVARTLAGMRDIDRPKFWRSSVMAKLLELRSFESSSCGVAGFSGGVW